MRKILKVEADPENPDKHDEYEGQRKIMLRKMKEKLNGSNYSERLENIAWIFCKIIKSKHHIKFLMSKEIIDLFFNSAISMNTSSIKATLNIMIHLLNVGLDMTQKTEADKIPELKSLLKASCGGSEPVQLARCPSSGHYTGELAD